MKSCIPFQLFTSRSHMINRIEHSCSDSKRIHGGIAGFVKNLIFCCFNYAIYTTAKSSIIHMTGSCEKMKYFLLYVI